MTVCRTLALSAATGCFLLGGAAIAAGITVHDARDRDVTIADPARIVSIGGAITEILYALGFEDRLAGVDSTSLYPAAALRDKPNVGYMRQLSAEGVLGLNPSLVLAAQGTGPKETMDVLDAAKVPLVLVPETFSEAGLLDKRPAYYALSITCNTVVMTFCLVALFTVGAVWAQALARQLSSGVLLTYNGDGHTAYVRHDPCVDAAVKGYIVDLHPPPPDTTCG